MMETPENPYESPQAEVSEVKPLTAQGVLSENMLFYLKGASPWLRFIGITGFIFLGILAVFGLIMIAGIQTIPIPGWNAALGMGFGIFYLGYLALLFFPVFFVFRFGTKIRSYLHTGDEADLEQAFKNNKSLWKFVGILCIISLSLLALTFFFVGIAAAFAAAF